MGRVGAYILGVSFVTIGVYIFWTDLEQRPPPFHPIASYVSGVVLTIFGLLTWAATRFRYGGGFWSIIGGLLVAGALTGTASIIETHIRGWRYDSPVAFYTRIATCWAVGGVFLLIGHRRHRKEKQALPPMDSPQPADTPIVESRRPLILTFVCILGIIGVIANLWRVCFGPPSLLGPWFLPFLTVSSVIMAMAMFGVWMMRRWAVYIYIGLCVVGQLLFLVMYDVIVWKAVLMQCVVIALLLVYFRKMR